jgi:membrane protein
MTPPKPTAIVVETHNAEGKLSLKKWFRVLLREFDEDGLKYRAMSLVYTSLLSLAPLLAVSFSILKAFGVHNQAQPLLLDFLNPLGKKAEEVTTNIITFVENIQVGVLGFVGFLMLFYTSVSLLEQIEDCFNHIWRVTKERSLYRRFSDYFSMILIGPVLLFSALGITASMTSTAIVQGLITLEPFGTLYYLIGLVLPYMLTVAAFTFAYSFIPNTPVKLRPALAGGLIAGLIWKTTGILFALFMANSAQYSAIYSGFAVILLSMVWLYISWLILLLGGVIVFHLQFPNYLNYAHRRPHLSIQCQERLSILLMCLIGRHHLRGESTCTLQSLAAEVNLPWEPVADQLENLKQGGLLMVIDGDLKAYIPARDTDAILLRDIVQATRTSGDQPALPILGAADGAIQQLLSSLDESQAKVLQNRSLRDVITDEENI